MFNLGFIHFYYAIVLSFSLHQSTEELTQRFVFFVCKNFDWLRYRIKLLLTMKKRLRTKVFPPSCSRHRFWGIEYTSEGNQ
ncbi:CLUMA_CG001905, isoform A [Clunio marinus]|uniref:CLUMA_CG001905, isoform A n=1 Tax=Clunio marinus TaxID=568069 RepID=A0A1J1HJ96_9DIPT|nr:CLUMA_CG001905, isoform A [Clunio marinus]